LRVGWRAVGPATACLALAFFLGGESLRGPSGGSGGRRRSEPSLHISDHVPDADELLKVLVRDLQVERLLDLVEQFDRRHGIQAQIIAEAVIRSDSVRIPLQVVPEGGPNAHGDIGFSSHAFSRGMTLGPFSPLSLLRPEDRELTKPTKRG